LNGKEKKEEEKEIDKCMETESYGKGLESFCGDKSPRFHFQSPYAKGGIIWLT